jgi:vacuolar fusion protein MON1
VQILLILTKSVNRCFEKNPKFDMAPLLGGTDAVFVSLIRAFNWSVFFPFSPSPGIHKSFISNLVIGNLIQPFYRNPATFLHAYTCLPLAQSTRQAASAVLQDIADSGVLFALLMCEHKVCLTPLYARAWCDPNCK